MCVTCRHTIHHASHRQGWSRALQPALRAVPVDAVHVECLDASGGQLGPGLTTAARGAVTRMVDLLAAEQGLGPVATVLCSVCADLRISGIVDRSNWVVSSPFPRGLSA